MRTNTKEQLKQYKPKEQEHTTFKGLSFVILEGGWNFLVIYKKNRYNSNLTFLFFTIVRPANV